MEMPIFVEMVWIDKVICMQHHGRKLHSTCVIAPHKETGMTSEFVNKLRRQWDLGKFVCVGLDTDAERLPKLGPPDVEKQAISLSQVMNFNMGIINATQDLTCAYKLNSAFYEAMSSLGTRALLHAVEYLRYNAPLSPVILDAKRGDIGATNEAYAKAVFDVMKAEAITINPYLGEEANKPFLERTDKGIVVLCRTSNRGAGEFQDLLTRVTSDELDVLLNGFRDLRHEHLMTWGEWQVTTQDGQPVYFIPLYQVVAMRVAHHWNKHGNCALVVGATYPKELRLVRQLVGDLPILVPGIGKQGGDLQTVINNGLDSWRQGLIINSSSGIIYASNGPDFAEAARRETLKLHTAINQLRG